MFDFLHFLAQTPPPVPPPYGNVSGELVIGIIGAIFTGMALLYGKKSGRKEEKEAQATHITNSPLAVELKDHYVTRREFEKLEASVNGTVTKMEGLFAQTMQAIEVQAKTTDRRIDNQQKRLMIVIESVAKSANDGRGKLWKVVNATANDLAAVKAETNVAKEIGRFGEAVIAAVANTSKQPS